MITTRLSAIFTGFTALAFLTIGCGSDDDPIPFEETFHLVPQFYEADENGDPSFNEPEFTVIADSEDSVNRPNDLAFHPHEDRAGELWLINENSTATGGSTVTIFDAGTEDQETLWLRDGNAWHFLAMPTAMAFADNGKWASGTGLQDNNQNNGTWAGPTLWSSDFEIYAAVGDPPTGEVNGSHLDMLHGSPYSMGIAYEENNAYWVFDGYNEHIVLYDFVAPHPPGGYDHSNGEIFRHTDVEVERHTSYPSHMIVDRATGWLYINDTGNERVLRMDTSTGEKAAELPDTGDYIEVHWDMQGTTFEVFADHRLSTPTGIALHDGTLFVSDTDREEIIAYDVDSGQELDRIDVGSGIRGITIGPDEKLWLANYDTSEILRLDPQ